MSYTPFVAAGALSNEQTAAYIERKADYEALDILREMDYLLVIEPRKQGKSSLIHHLIRHPTLSSLASVYIDVSTLDRSTEATWYETLCSRILRQLGSWIPRNEWPTIIAPQNHTGWRDFLLDVATFATNAKKRTLIALDEIGAVTFPGATGFFSVLRDVFNSRGVETEFKWLTFLLAGAFHPRNMIKDDRISPFNIARRVRLPDFTTGQIRELVGKGEWTDAQADMLAERIGYWTNGHPYLTQLLCSYLKKNAEPADVDVAVERLLREDENLIPPMMARLDNNEKLYMYTRRIQTDKHIMFYPAADKRHAQLELLGIIKKNAQGYCIIRNRIYKEVLRIHNNAVVEVTGEQEPEQINLDKLHQILLGRFDESELRALCFAMKNIGQDVNYDDLSGVSRADKIIKLIQYLERHDCVSEFIQIGKQQRPDIPWNDIIQETQSTHTG